MSRARAAGWALLLSALACRSAPAPAQPTPSLTPPPRTATRTPFAPLAPTHAGAWTPAADPTWPAPFTLGLRTPAATAIPAPAAPIPLDPQVITILLAGSDRRAAGAHHTDVLVLLSLHPARRAAALVSIPRDLYVYLPGFGMQRINAAYEIGNRHRYPGGGAGLLLDSVRYNLGVPVAHLALIDMQGFTRILDALGGLDVAVLCPFTDWRLRDPGLPPDDEDSWELHTLEPGVQRMDGGTALWYARARSRSSDFDRARRQHELLRALHQRVLRLDLITHLPRLYAELGGMVTTDLALADLLDLAGLGLRLDAARVRSRFIGREQVTSWRVPGSGAQVLLPRPDEIRALLDQALAFEAEPVEDPAAPQVLVLNRSSQADWGRLAAARLAYAGVATELGARGRGEREPSRLIEYAAVPPALLERLHTALGLAPGAPRPDDPADPDLPLLLIVGDDFDPCFDPTRGQGN